MSGKKRCGCCGKWFVPDVRVRATQKTCSEAECRVARRQRTQAAWRERNAGYAADWRLRQKVAAVERAEEARRIAEKAGLPLPPEVDIAPAVPPGPGLLGVIPWAFAKDSMGVQGAVFIGFLVRLGVRVAKDAMEAHVAEIKGEVARVRPMAAEDSSRGGREACDGSQ